MGVGLLEMGLLHAFSSLLINFFASAKTTGRNKQFGVPGTAAQGLKCSSQVLQNIKWSVTAWE